MQHGGDLTSAIAHHGGERGDWLDLSTGINPRPWPMPEHLPAHAWTSLPTRAAADRLLASARQAYAVPDGAGLVAAPGTQSLIQWLPHLAPGGAVAVAGPTYAEHAIAWRRHGRTVLDFDADGAIPDGARHLVVVNPNNPDGRLVAPGRLAFLAQDAARRGGWLVIDESFADVVPEASASGLCAGHPIVILRSFGKFYGLAGLRLGFLVANPGIAAAFAEALGPWSVAGPALELGARALDDGDWAAGTRRWLAAEAEALDHVLDAAGLRVVGGTTLYRLARHPDARRIHGELARRRIWVRRFDWDAGLLRFGLPPDAQGRMRLADALKACLAHAAASGPSAA